jgi:hypothetical protein
LNWLAFVHAFRTLFYAPTPELTGLFERVGDLIEAA